MQVRAARAADVPAVLPMVEKLCALHQSWDAAKYSFLQHIPQMYDGWLRGRAGDRRSVFLVAETSEPAKIVGFTIGTVEREIPIYRLKEFGFLHDLWVEPEYRHEGVARQMVMLAVEKFKEMGVAQIRLDTAAENEPARRLFAACGFRASVTEMLMELKPVEQA
ncbi:MAG TPA: GNAT family N-acetyltransferase [Tepidisphaeraceae bacterium]|jgi:GNAT superfamily N-acetyltransferase|nr:GNAT family N-acetyltransferase [Tepidisphaeraceae bacterium]